MLFKLMNFLFDAEKVLKPLFNGGIWGGEFEKDILFLKVGGGVVEFEVVNAKDVVCDKVVDEGRHVN